MYIIFKGGLGNQMFQFALFLALKSRGYKVFLDTSLYLSATMHNGFELSRVFMLDDIDIQMKCSVIRNILVRALLKNKSLCSQFLFIDDLNKGFQPEVFETKRLIIDGYFQSEKYFKNIEAQIRKAFIFCDIDKYNQSISTEMYSCNSVSLHVRRGDYAKFGMKILGEEYYNKAIVYIIEKVDNPIFYIFSDDAAEAERIAHICNIKYYIIKHNNGVDNYKDMFLMSQCRHHIIANSSFSWWGAWLGNNSDKIVVAPNWKNDDWRAEKWILVE